MLNKAAVKGSGGHPKQFKDKNGNIIKPGDILLREFYARWRERPGHKRVAINGMSGNEVIVSDEGGFLTADIFQQ